MTNKSDDVTVGKVVKWSLMGAAGIIGLTVLGSAVGIITSPFRAVSGVVNRTMDSGNIVRTYELFHDRHNGYKARLAQIRQSASDLERETDAGERSRIRIELNAQRQNCRDIAAAYNADSEKTNRDIFRERGAPERLNMEECNR